MTTITKDMLEKAYEIFQTHEKDITPLVEMGMNENSASMTMTWFESLLTGKLYKRTGSAMQIEFFLDKLYKNNEKEKLSFALESLRKYVSYYHYKKLKQPKILVQKYEKKLASMGGDLPISYPDDLEISGSKIIEGAMKSIVVNAYERNPRARMECIDKYGYNCSVCKLNFEYLYGEIGRHFIHVHHLKPLSKIKEKYEVNATADLRPVCPNCHAMLHRKDPPYTIEELKARLLPR